jgi:hypothetical protein
MPPIRQTPVRNQHDERHRAFVARIHRIRTKLQSLSDPILKPRALAILRIADGVSLPQIASETGITPNCIRRVKLRFELYGLAGLADPEPLRKNSTRQAVPSALAEQA